MRIDDTDSEEREDCRPRCWPWMVAAVSVVAATVTTVVFTRQDPAPLDGASTSTTVRSIDMVPAAVVPPFVPNEMPKGFPDLGSDYSGAALDTLYERATESGIFVRLQDLGGQGAQASRAMTDDNVVEFVTPTVAAVPATPSVPQGWTPPGWCSPAGGFRVSMRFQDSIGTSQGSWYTEPRNGLNSTLFSSGFAEGTPFRVLVLQVAADVTSVAVRFIDGAADVGQPENGWLALAVPGAREGRFELTVEDSGGSRVIGWRDFLQMGDPAWQEECIPPPPVLPPAGAEQPADAAAVERIIRNRFDLLWDANRPREDKPDDLLDDWTGVVEASAEVFAGRFGEAAKSAIHLVTGFVFVSPTVAWVTYDISTINGRFTNRFGYATLIDGSWRLSRDVICQDLALAGAMCEPSSNTIQPPAS